MPAIRALPAIPSPIPAPMAPPAMISPPPMSAPAAIMGFILILLDNWQWSYQVVGPACSGRLVVVVVEFHRLAEVQDGQQREDERLDGADEKVEALPDRVGRPHDPRREQGDQCDQDAAGEDIAEESQGQRYRLGDLLDEVDRRHQ